MSCNGFVKYNLGEWPEERFLSHVQTCAECRQAIEEDARLLDLSRSLKADIEAPFLWSRIESEVGKISDRKRGGDSYRWVYRIAALLLLSVGLLLVSRFFRQPSDSGLLANSALSRVEAQEKEYEAAIRQLEKVVSPRLSRLDQELMLLYRDRLETIDTQIEQCKEALAANPANAHIRRYLLAALKDKKETLNEIMGIAAV